MGCWTEGRPDVCIVSLTRDSHAAIEDSSGGPCLSEAGEKTSTLQLTSIFRNIRLVLVRKAHVLQTFTMVLICFSRDVILKLNQPPFILLYLFTPVLSRQNTAS